MHNQSFNTIRSMQSHESWETKTWWSALMRVHCCLLVLVGLPGSSLLGRELVWQNDTLSDGQQAVVQAGFVNGDIGAAVFDPPCGVFPLQIKRVQVFWFPPSGPTTQVMTHIHVYGSGAPNPGPPIFTGEGAVMTAGYMNEFSAGGLNWVVDHGPFGIGVEYVNGIEGPVNASSGHLTADSDGCQAGRNLIFNAADAQWFNPCSAGMSGDFIIRVVFDSLAVGCFADYDCDSHVDLQDTRDFQNCFSGENVAASPNCRVFDCDGDNDVDTVDFGALIGCLAGPDVICSPSCASCVDVPARASPNSLLPQTLPQASSFILQSSVPSRMKDGMPDSCPQWNANSASSPRWTLAQTIVADAIVAVITIVFIGPCWTMSCRSARAIDFRLQATNPNALEQNRINQALDWLLASGDSQAEECAIWYDEHLARQSTTFGTIRVNHWPDPQGFVGQRLAVENRVVVHETYVTGPDFSPQLLGLILFAEWQHIDNPGVSETQLEVLLKAFRQRLGLTDLRPDMQHGFSEGSGG